MSIMYVQLVTGFHNIILEGILSCVSYQIQCSLLLGHTVLI